MSLSAVEQYLLELMNRARLDPLAEAARYEIDLNEGLTPGTLDGTQKQVLAPNDLLHQAAEGHSIWMLDTDTFSHTGQSGSSAGDRMSAAGYVFSGSWSWGENLSWSGTTGTLDLFAAIEGQHQSLFLSAGHRENILNEGFREVGLGQIEGLFTHTNGVTYNASMVTQNFASSGSSVFVTGVVIDDTDNDLFYTPGEGASGAIFSTGGYTTSSSAVGGYALELPAAGSTTVTIAHEALSAVVELDLSAGNVKLDVIDDAHLLVSGDLTIVSGVGQVSLLGVSNSKLTGDDNGNTLSGNRGDNELSGQGGVDFIYGQFGDDTLYGGAGGDALFGNEGFDILLGEDGDDGLNGGPGPDVLSGGSGVDWLFGGEGNDYMEGGPDLDAMFGEGGEDHLIGGTGGDSLDGGYGDDLIEGAEGVDWIYGSFGDDEIYGATSDQDSLDTDALFGQDGNDILHGGAGGDSLDGGADHDALFGGGGEDWLFGQAGNDQLSGGDGSDVLFGGDGNDTLNGGLVGDSLDGGAGQDTLNGGAGVDILFGGTGADHFVFNLPSDGEDLIRDFTTGEDSLWLHGTGFGIVGTGSIAGNGLWQTGSGLPGDFGDAGEPVLYFESFYRALWFDADGGDSTNATAFAALETGLLTESDVFIL